MGTHWAKDALSDRDKSPETTKQFSDQTTITCSMQWYKFPDVKPSAGQLCIVAAGPGNCAQFVALLWNEFEEEFEWADDFGCLNKFPTKDAKFWTPFPDDPEV